MFLALDQDPDAVRHVTGVWRILAGGIVRQGPIPIRQIVFSRRARDSHIGGARLDLGFLYSSSGNSKTRTRLSVELQRPLDWRIIRRKPASQRDNRSRLSPRELVCGSIRMSSGPLESN